MLSGPLALEPFRVWRSSQSGIGGAWPEAVHSGALCAHLNLQGEADLTARNSPAERLRPGVLCWTRGLSAASRLSGRERHECLTLVYPDGWLGHALQNALDSVSPALRELASNPGGSGIVKTRLLEAPDRAWALGFMAPHLCEQARRLLDSARLTDFFVKELFPPLAEDPAGTIVSRAERVGRERVERAKAEMLRHLDAVPSLEDLAATVGCSPHYLSRTFSQIEGLPLVLWLRRVRIERAAELIATGRCNVSEAALEVGYRSFSHFSRAFAEEKGTQPSKWVAHLAQSQISIPIKP